MSRPIGPNERLARIAFHLALFLPGISLPWEWPTALSLNARREPGEGRSWGWMVLALALLDTLAALSIVLLHTGVLPQPKPAELAPHGPRIGAVLDERPAEGARIEEVMPGSPAARAGIAAGDRIVAVDGEGVHDAAGLLDALAAKPSGVARTLSVERGGESLELEVVPVDASELAPGPRGLFDPLPESESEPDAFAVGASSMLPAAILVLFLWWRAGRRASGARTMLGWFALLVLSGAVATFSAYAIVTAFAGAPTRGGLLIAVASGSAAPLLVAWIALRRLERRAVLPERAPFRVRRVVSTYLLGIVYLLALGLRVVWISIGVASLFALGGVDLPSNDPTQMLDALGLGPSGVLAFVIAAAVIAPIGEELGFRGLLLPWLARGMSPVAAVVGSAFVFGLAHPHYGAQVLVPVAYGLVLGWARLRTGGLTASMLLHATINVVASSPLWWPLVAR